MWYSLIKMNSACRHLINPTSRSKMATRSSCTPNDVEKWTKCCPLQKWLHKSQLMELGILHFWFLLFFWVISGQWAEKKKFRLGNVSVKQLWEDKSSPSCFSCYESTSSDSWSLNLLTVSQQDQSSEVF